MSGIDLSNDERYQAFKTSLNQLTTLELKRLRDWTGPICLDKYNYDEQEGTYCPLAIALGLPDFVDSFVKEFIGLTPSSYMTNDICRSLINSMGVKIYEMRKYKGEFYTKNREEDMRRVVAELLKERGC